ncbi:unnamed protein product [Peniophora sp. CBMAI 1063]|nr:unnamed protein product [Peniophora sp. CBMAI 1063]
MGRVGCAFITKDDNETRWNDILSRAGSLPALSTLHLYRRLSVSFNPTPLHLDAPNLRILFIDCEGHINAPLLRTVQFLSLSKTFPISFRSILASCNNLTEISFVARDFSNYGIWKEIYAMLNNKPITSLTVAFVAWNTFTAPSPITLPALTSLMTNVPTPVRCAKVVELAVETELQETLDMLRALPSVRGLLIGSHIYSSTAAGASAVRDSPVIILPHLVGIEYRASADLHLCALLSALRMPRLSNLEMHLDVDLFQERHAAPALENASSNPRAWLDRLRHSMSSLAVHLKALTTGPVKLLIHMNDHPELGPSVDFCARDSAIADGEYNGLSFSATARHSASFTSPSPGDFSPFVHILPAFSWSTVTVLEMSSEVHWDANTHSSQIYSDLFSPQHASDFRSLTESLDAMAAVTTLVVHIGLHMGVTGIPVLKMERMEGPELWPELTELTLVYGDDNAHAFTREWWKDVNTFLGRRRNKCRGRILSLEGVLDGQEECALRREMEQAGVIFQVLAIA